MQHVNTVDFGAHPGTIQPTRHPNVLLVEVPAATEGAVQVLLKGQVQNKPVSNILDFVTPGKAIFKFVKPENPKPQTKPKPTQRKPRGQTSQYP